MVSALYIASGSRIASVVVVVKVEMFVWRRFLFLLFLPGIDSLSLSQNLKRVFDSDNSTGAFIVHAQYYY